MMDLIFSPTHRYLVSAQAVHVMPKSMPIVNSGLQDLESIVEVNLLCAWCRRVGAWLVGWLVGRKSDQAPRSHNTLKR